MAFAPGLERTLAVNVTAKTSGFVSGLKSAMTSLGGFKGSILGVTGVMAGLGAAIGVKAIKAASSFEKAMADVKAAADASESEMAILEEKAKSLGKTTKFMVEDIAGAEKALAKSGYTAKETAAAMEGVADAAAASGEPIEQVGIQLTNVVKGYGLAADETQRVADVFAEAARSANVNIDSLAKGMEILGPIAKDMGMSIEETTSVLGKLGDAGIQAGKAGRQLRTAFLDFQKLKVGDTTKDAREALQKFGISIKDITSGKYDFMELITQLRDAGASAGDMATIFTKRASTALVKLGDSSGEVDKLTNKLKDAKGAAEEMAEVKLDTLSGQMEVLKGSVNLLFTELGENLVPVIRDFVKEGVIPAVNTITDLIDGTKSLEDVMGPMGNVVGEVLNGLKLGFQNVGDSFATLWTVLNETVGMISALFRGDFSDAWNHIKGIATAFIDYIKRWFGRLVELLHLQPAIDLLKGPFTKAFQTALDIIKEFVSFFTSIPDKIGGAIDKIKGAVDTVKGAMDTVTGFFSGSGDIVKATEGLEEHKNMIGDLSENIAGMAKDYKNAGGDMEDFANRAEGNIELIIDKVKNLKEKGVDTGQALELALEAASRTKYGDAWEEFSDRVLPHLRKEIEKVTDSSAEYNRVLEILEDTVAGHSVISAFHGLESQLYNSVNAIDTTKSKVNDLGGSLEELDEKTEETGENFEDIFDEIKKVSTDFVDEESNIFFNLNETIRRLQSDSKDKILSTWRDIQFGVKSILTRMVNDVGNMFVQNRQARQEYETAIDQIRNQTDQKEQKALQKKKQRLAELKEQWQSGELSYKEYQKAKETALDNYHDKLDEIQEAEEKNLGEAEENWKEQRQSLHDVLMGMVKDFLGMIKNELLLRAAKESAIAIAQTALALPTAIQHYTAAGAYTAGAAGLAIAGFEEGAVIERPTMGMVAEREPEAITPLSELPAIIAKGFKRSNMAMARPLHIHLNIDGREITDVVIDESQYRNKSITGVSNGTASISNRY